MTKRSWRPVMTAWDTVQGRHPRFPALQLRKGVDAGLRRHDEAATG